LLTTRTCQGANPGGGGIEMLARLTGRSRALEVVLGADVLDADTAALYGCKSFSRSHSPLIASLPQESLVKQEENI
jgi:hypothetical protein